MLSETAVAMRREFDLTFSQARRLAPAEPHSLLAVRVGDEHYALRVNEIAGLFVDRHVVPLPTSVSEFIGVASFRGQVASVYDLASLLGYPQRTAQRWLVLARYRHPVALAFTRLEAHFTAASEQIVSSAATTSLSSPATSIPPRPHVVEAVVHEGILRSIVDLQAVIESIQRRIDATRK